MDLDAILLRSPSVVLVDELAHTNVPGSRHEKRWQDVQTLREAGIEVISTVNIQHLESLNDVTEAITGIRQRETVPDDVVRAADQIELVDMSPQALRRRMAHGNIYTADKVDAALSQYFREGNLTALRELALLWLADRVEEGMDRYREKHQIDSTWATRERIIVPVSGGPESSTLMRRASRIASRAAAGEWSALYVARRDGLTGVSPDVLTGLRQKAEQLGGTFHTVVSDDPAEGILDFARAENASQVVVGASRRGRISALLRPGVGERVVAASGDIDVHIVAHDYSRGTMIGPRSPETLSRRRRTLGYVFGVLTPTLVSLLLWLTHQWHGLTTEALILMVVVVATALVGGLLPAVIAALASGILLNLFFVPPLYVLTINEPENALAILLFVLVGVAVATVVDNAARRTKQAIKARAEADALTVLSHSLLNATDDPQGLLSSACELFNARGAAIIRSSRTDTEPASGGSGADMGNGTNGAETEITARRDGPGTGAEQSHGEGVPRVEVLASCGEPPLTIEAADMVADIDDVTVLALAGTKLPASQRGLLNAYAAYARVMTERRAATAAEVERLRLTEVDRTRTALLAAVSHDLRSPLSAVKMAVDSLGALDVTWSEEDKADFLETIREATERLITLVNNLLDMSRIHTGSIRAAVSEISLARAVRNSLVPLDGGVRIQVDIDEELVVLADPGLLDRVLANIAENALKYTPDQATITIDAAPVGSDRVALRIADTGPGVRDRDHDRLFAPFQRLGDVPGQDGVGLGLAVARGLLEAIGGTVTTEDTPGGGLTFLLELRRPPDPPHDHPSEIGEDPAAARLNPEGGGSQANVAFPDAADPDGRGPDAEGLSQHASHSKQRTESDRAAEERAGAGPERDTLSGPKNQQTQHPGKSQAQRHVGHDKAEGRACDTRSSRPPEGETP
ncbi:two-component system sensor histidine kinase KdpD [Nocardioides daedukensis]|uniref:histidine kinase n=2 Tax=Nocardioides daedukensis TaxID=634462 RepID=A0A7Y9RVZ8_9ACTN|nr:two-component system sensor histidine kinase KdpD [Nocardioides daedukensis]